jgi:hypothetical protein
MQSKIESVLDPEDILRVSILSVSIDVEKANVDTARSSRQSIDR